MRLVINRFLLTTALVLSALTGLRAQQHPHEGDTQVPQLGAEAVERGKFNVGEMIMHHIKDDYGWEFAHGVTLHLPVIVYAPDRGLEVFSSARLAEGQIYNGYKIEHGKIHRVDAAGNIDHEASFYNFSITKNVASLLLSAVIMLLLFTAVSRGYEKNQGRAPSGVQSLLEPIILFVRDEIAKPSIGPKYPKYLPYLLTLFFFILINNLLGILPGSANLTGNITVTLVLAVITFLIVTFSGNKHYWLHILRPTGVPIALLPIMIPVEIIGVFMKPLSLMIRLFANITAGHIIILSLLGLIFMANNMGGMMTGVAISPVVLIFTLFLNLIEILVAFIQAFIFALLSAMYIGSAVEDHHEADHGIGYEGTPSELG